MCVYYLFIIYFNLCRQSDLARLIHNKGLYSTLPNVSIALRRLITPVHVFDGLKLFRERSFS